MILAMVLGKNSSSSFSLICTVGFLDGWYFDEKCIARQDHITGSVLPVENIKHFPQAADALQALYSGEVRHV